MYLCMQLGYRTTDFGDNESLNIHEEAFAQAHNPSVSTTDYVCSNVVRRGETWDLVASGTPLSEPRERKPTTINLLHSQK